MPLKLCAEGSEIAGNGHCEGGLRFVGRQPNPSDVTLGNLSVAVDRIGEYHISEADDDVSPHCFSTFSTSSSSECKLPTIVDFFGGTMIEFPKRPSRVS